MTAFTLALGVGAQVAQGQSVSIDSRLVNGLWLAASVFGAAAAIGILLNILRALGLVGFLDSVELRHEACVDCHHDYAMPKQKDRDNEEPYPGDVYRVEVRNRIRVGIEKVTLVIDSSDPPVEGLQVKAKLMNDRRADLPESHEGVTIAPNIARHWTVAIMYDEGPDAQKPFLGTVNGPRPLIVGMPYRVQMHAEAAGKPIGKGEFQVFYTQQNHMRFRRLHD